MGLPDHANAKPVSKLLAFFEQQGNTPATPKGDTSESQGNNGTAQKTRVRSNFIPVGRSMEFNGAQRGEAVMSPTSASAPVMTATKAVIDIGEPLKNETALETVGLGEVADVPETQASEEPPVTNVTAVREVVSAEASEAPTASPDVTTNDTQQGESTNGTASEIKKEKTAESDNKAPTPKKTVAPIVVAGPSTPTTSQSAISSPKTVTTPKTTMPPHSPRSLSTPKKTTETTSVKLPSTTKAAQSRNVSTPKATAEPKSSVKSPKTPTAVPPSMKSSPAQKKSLGPLSPAPSTSTKRSSSPFMHSPPGPTKIIPPSSSSHTPAKTPTSKSQPRKEFIGKVVNITPKTTPRTLSSSTPRTQVKASPTPSKATPSTKTSDRASKDGRIRPRSALDMSTPPSARRIVSQPPRPSTSASNKSSPSVNRSSSLRTLPRANVGTDHPPVPPIGRAAGSLSPEQNQDWSHLPTFMRPTQASSGKAVAKPKETRGRSGSFKS